VGDRLRRPDTRPEQRGLRPTAQPQLTKRINLWGQNVGLTVLPMIGLMIFTLYWKIAYGMNGEMMDPNKAYILREFCGDVQDGLFSEPHASKPMIDHHRRRLQRHCLEHGKGPLTGPEPVPIRIGDSWMGEAAVLQPLGPVMGLPRSCPGFSGRPCRRMEEGPRDRCSGSMDDLTSGGAI
jgi:hypothetical protein